MNTILGLSAIVFTYFVLVAISKPIIMRLFGLKSAQFEEGGPIGKYIMGPVITSLFFVFIWLTYLLLKGPAEYLGHAIRTVLGI